MKNYKTEKLITGFILTAALFVLFTNKVYADCIEYYGGGEVCSYSNSFRIEKKVRVPGKNVNWEDKVTNVSETDIVEFKVTVENRSDSEADAYEAYNEFKFSDFLPDTMEWVDGASGLTEEWGGFKPGEIRTFFIKAKLKNSEFENNITFEKCVVNKVELYWKFNLEDSDIATVCYGDANVEVLPATGPSEIVAALGMLITLTGLVLRKQARLA